MKRFFIIAMALLLVSFAFAEDNGTLEIQWNHTLMITFMYPGGTPSGATNMPTPDGNADRSTAGGHCTWTQDGMWFATWISKVSPTYEVSDTFFPGDYDWGHMYMSSGGYYISSLASYKTVGRTAAMELAANDTLHLRFWFNDGTTDYVWGLDTVFTEDPSGGSGMVSIVANMVAADSYTGPAYSPCWDGILVGIDEPNPGTVTTPRDFNLAQNTPNPFNAKTSIEYSIPEDGDVSLNVYDIEGRKITTLVNEHQNAGYYNVKWDGTDDSGAEVATGSYFYKLTSGDYEAQQRMILLK